MTSTSVPPTRSELIERFTAPGQPFEIGERTVRGAGQPARDVRRWSAVAAEVGAR